MLQSVVDRIYQINPAGTGTEMINSGRNRILKNKSGRNRIRVESSRNRIYIYL